ncbi:Site-specific recombinase XerD [Paenibacillus sp. cl141a]|uniref:site-specific integrase n=1 Tax=Paenibacillus sp. cl141a TaxID=1761877 RepID=UPI0008AC0482|nr:site-specific integrase [Paenibacillus sp. cl141a]SEK77330.1 Site-specific recombinase XerD [Paenibacillus sp. cl141a]
MYYGLLQERGCKCEKGKKCTCDATWSVTVDIGRDPITNKRKQKELSGFRTKRDAEKAAAALVTELDQGTYVQEKNVTFKEFVKTWLEIYKNTVKISSVRVREHESGRLMRYFENVKMKDITKKMYQDALNDLQKANGKKKGLSYNTISGVHSTGRMIFSKAVELDVIKNNPTQFAKLPRTQKTVEEIEQEEEVVKYLEKEELAKFLNTAETQGLDQDHIIFMLLAYSGMRAGELCALRWSDLDMDEHTISITKTYYNPTNRTREYQLLTPKTKTSKRKIDIDPDVVKLLRKHRKWQKEIMMEYRTTYHDGDFVIAKTDPLNAGYPEFIKTIENRMRRLLKLAGLNEKLTPHSLRHTHTSLLAEAKVGLTEIMERLGHKDDDTTRNVYTHVTKTMKKEASHKFSELMRSL